MVEIAAIGETLACALLGACAEGARDPVAKAVYDTRRMLADMTLRGWNDSALARQAGLSTTTTKYFLDGYRQTAKTADKLARALGYTVKRYLTRVEAVA